MYTVTKFSNIKYPTAGIENGYKIFSQDKVHFSCTIILNIADDYQLLQNTEMIADARHELKLEGISWKNVNCLARFRLDRKIAYLDNQKAAEDLINRI